MKTLKDCSEEFSVEQIKSWGFLKKVKRELIIDNCIKEVNNPDDDSKKIILENKLNTIGIKSDKDLCNWQKQFLFNQDDWKDYLIRAWKWECWCFKNFETQLPNYFLKRKEYLDLVSYSLLRVKEKSLANELYLRIKENEAEFCDLASKYSQGPEKNHGGIVGPVPITQPHFQLGRLLKTIQPGKLCAPTFIDSWWVLVRLEELKNASLDESVALKLSLELGDKYIAKLLNEENIFKTSNEKK